MKLLTPNILYQKTAESILNKISIKTNINFNEYFSFENHNLPIIDTWFFKVYFIMVTQGKKDIFNVL